MINFKNKLGITIISDFVTSSAVENSELSTIELGDSYTRHFSYILPKNINIILTFWIIFSLILNYFSIS